MYIRLTAVSSSVLLQIAPQGLDLSHKCGLFWEPPILRLLPLLQLGQ